MITSFQIIGLGIALMSQTPRETVVTDSFLHKVALIESSNGKQMVGDHGKALGYFQFHKPTWEHVNKLKGWNWTWKRGAVHPTVSKLYAKAYFQYLENGLQKRLGRKPTHAELYASWNIGLGGFAKRGFRLANCPEITKRAVKKLS